MKTQTYITILLVIFIISSCTNKNKQKGLLQKPITEIKFDKSLCQPVVSLDQISDDVFYVQLETNNESEFGDISKIEVTDSNIFIFDKKYTKGVLVFDINGKFINRIGRSGSGPDELRIPKGFCFNDLNNEIEIFDYELKKIFFYNLNGEVVRKKNMFLDLIDFFPVDKVTTLVYQARSKSYLNPNNGIYELCFLNEDFEIKNEYLYVDKFLMESGMTFTPNRNFHKFNNQAFFHYWYSDTLYSIQDESLMPRYVFKPKIKTLQNRYSFTSDKIIQEITNGNYTYNINNINIVGDILIFSFLVQGGESYSCIYSLSNNDNIIARQFNSDEVSSLQISAPIFCTKTHFISVIYPEEESNGFTEKIIENPSRKTYGQYFDTKKLKENITKYDNPIICFYKPSIAFLNETKN